MKLKLKFFGRLTELTGVNELTWETAEELSLSEIEAELSQQYNNWTEQTYRIAINQTLVTDGKVSDGDEVAFLPPFAGG